MWVSWCWFIYFECAIIGEMSFICNRAMYCVAVWLVVFSEVCVAKMIIFQWCNKYIQTQFERLMQLAGCLRKKWPVACIIITRWFWLGKNVSTRIEPLRHSRWYFPLMRVGDNHYVVESTSNCQCKRVELQLLLIGEVCHNECEDLDW